MKQEIGNIKISKICRVTIPIYEGYERINTTYRAADPWKQLSPMRLGPFIIRESLAKNVIACINGKYIEQPILDYYPDGILPGFKYIKDGDNEYQYAECSCFEAYWQYCGKIYQCDVKNGIIQKTFFERRGKGLSMNLDNSKPRELRRTFKKSTHGVPILSYYNGEFMDWVKSRVKVYCPLYSELVLKTNAYSKLKDKLMNGTNIQLLDPDFGLRHGYDIGDITEEKLKEQLKSTQRPFCHSMVLACTLLNYKIW